MIVEWKYTTDTKKKKKRNKKKSQALETPTKKKKSQIKPPLFDACSLKRINIFKSPEQCLFYFSSQRKWVTAARHAKLSVNQQLEPPSIALQNMGFIPTTRKKKKKITNKKTQKKYKLRTSARKANGVVFSEL